MVTNNQVRKLMKYLQEKKSLGVAASKSGIGPADCVSLILLA